MADRVSPDELRKLFLFEALNPEQLTWLSEHGEIEEREPGTTVYAEGDPATCFFVLLSGTIKMSRNVSGARVEISRTSQAGSYGGSYMAYLGDRVPQRYLQTLTALTRSQFYVLPAADFATVVTTWFPMTVHLLEGLYFGNQASQATVGQRERLQALGSLTAGLTHELNNPAAATARAASLLRERVAKSRHKLAALARGDIPRERLAVLVDLQEDAVERCAKAKDLSPVEANDREDELGDWLEERDVPFAWDLSPTLVAAGIDVEWLSDAESRLGGEHLDSALHWIGYTLETEQLMMEISQASGRISELVTAAKQYSQLDRAPHQWIDVHEGIDSTLVMLSGKINKKDITVVKEYDRTLPQIPAYPGELNQVWTNLIVNAIGAMNGQGTLTIRTSLRRPEDPDSPVQVEVCDTGPGVPKEIQERIFEPFFTTKPVGEGTGLGLDISWRIVVNRHGGDLTVESVPGDTKFVVCLPRNEPHRNIAAERGVPAEPAEH
ncbi:ATP-binding protein [Cryptosporangium phraense]|uniref:histidine kinase n=1 Tax=Cryptosporangium phraense TaxID=2593070 RepID=A0A545AG62_9ACTN|nr:ATP-binding protein [Cryptosporangium phraense]TQS40271.1 cyclic nucleotide-binding domain-containing protein [Cryptosporangium phraense]